MKANNYFVSPFYLKANIHSWVEMYHSIIIVAPTSANQKVLHFLSSCKYSMNSKYDEFKNLEIGSFLHNVSM